jgi:3-hydroxy-9,10-secoandrosta-1,3,5(10)-triene-9,17-dione monooxygenase
VSESQSIKAPEPDLSPETVIERSREMIPVLRKRAQEADRQRALPPETFQDFLDAGFYRLLQPRRFGGYEMGLRTFCDVMTNVARGCGSSGWVLCLTSAHTFHLSAFPEEGQVEMYGDDGDLRSPLIFAPQGTATPVEGGFRVTGRWNYNSGGEHSNWLAISALVPGEDGSPKDMIMAAIRRAEYEIFDNWHVMGMRATASKQAVVEDVFVPERRVISQGPWFAGRAPGYEVHENPFYRTPPLQVFASELSSICVGLAESAIDAFCGRAMTKTTPFPPFGPLREQRSVQRRIGYARAKTDAAAAVLDRMIHNQNQLAEMARGGPIDFREDDQRRAFLAVQQVGDLTRDAVELLFDASGTSATQIGQPMERIHRDMSMVRTHYMMDSDRTAENWGATALGLEAHSPN